MPGTRPLRIMVLSAGTGSFHCGISVRDLALADGLRQRGHLVRVTPLYLPLRLEGPAEGLGPLFLGGVNMFLQQHVPPCRVTPRWLDAAWDCPHLLRFAAGLSDMTRARGAGSLTVSMLRGRHGHQRKEIARLMRWLRRQAVDVVVLSSILLSGLAGELAALGLPVFCLMGGEEGFIDCLGAEHADPAWTLIRSQARHVTHFLPVSAYAAAALAPRLGLTAERWTVLHPGLDLAGFTPADQSPCEPVIGHLAHLVPIKGLHTLVAGVGHLRNRPVGAAARLLVVGSRTPADRLYVASQCRRARRAGIPLALVCNVDRQAKIAQLRQMSVLCVPPTYPEAFGLYLIEAMACGVPVVVPQRGALAEVVAATGGGITYPVDDHHGPDPDEPLALAQALAGLLQDPGRCRDLGRRGHDAVHQRFTHQAAAAALEAIMLASPAVAARVSAPSG